jgi:hypothetical protein
MVRISSEWRFIPQSVVLTERAFEELSVLRKCSEYKIVRYDDELRLERSDKTIQMKQDDVSVYGKILQLTSVRDFASQATGVIIGELCSFPIRKRYDGCECPRASQSIKRLQQAGYLFYFKTSEVIIPIVRMLDGIVYDQEGGTPISISEKGENRSRDFLSLSKRKSRNHSFAYKKEEGIR